MLQKTKQFQEDINKYTSAIEKIENEQEKLEIRKLLNDLVYEVKNMDNMFMDMVYSKQLPSLGNEMREKITAIRKQLDRRLSNK